MSRNYKFWDQEKPYFISFATVNWIDVFTRTEYKNIIVDSINYCIEKKGLVVFAWVIMTNHIHMIIGTEGDKMENIIRDLKKNTSKLLIKTIKENTRESRSEWMLTLFKNAAQINSNNVNYQFWQQHNQPIELYNNYLIEQKLDYLHNNPVKAGIVFNACDYIYSSANDYAGENGFVKVTLIN
jgi:REP-associated tyrosine transposase